MKKLITVMFFLLSITVFAQERGAGRSEMSDDERAARGARNLAMQLDLNEKQEEELKAWFAERIEYQKAQMAQKDKSRKKMKKERQEMRRDRMEMNEEQKADLREILTEEQYTKWESLQEKRRKGRKNPERMKQN